MKVYGVPLSVHTRKLLLAARIKGIDCELRVTIPVLPDTLPADWREISPMGLIPAIDDAGFRLADSTAILHYLERRHPEPALLPADDRELGVALFLDAWAGGALFRDVGQPLFHNRVVNPKIRGKPADDAAIETAKSKAAEAFRYLESRVSGAFLVGASLTIADLAVISNLILLHYLGDRIGPAYPRLGAYFKRHLDTDPIREALGQEAPFAEQMGLDRTFIG